MKRIDLRLSANQADFIERIAADHPQGLADFIRKALIRLYPDMPDDFQERGKYDRSLIKPEVSKQAAMPDGEGMTIDTALCKRGDIVSFSGSEWEIAAVLDNGYSLKKQIGTTVLSKSHVLFSEVTYLREE